MERIEATLGRVADGMTKIHQALLGDVNSNNNYKVASLLVNKAGREQMRRVIMKEQETEGAQAHGGAGNDKSGTGFRNEDGAIQTDVARKLEDAN